jgi:hypothetical protein
MNNTALIFIPDISGYTEFVTQTEIKHSKHIISELLEIIINGNQIGMTVSEIEGDAVLFYRMGKAPTLKELVNQVKKIFIDFHTHLKIIHRDNVCQCGACRSAINLTLKFITHYGELDETVIGNFSKIIGSDVILAHRLLKNKLDAKEYLLLTENYWINTNSGTDNDFDIEPFKDHAEEVENFENVKLKYTLLSSIREKISEPAFGNRKQFYKEKPDAFIAINAPILLVHELLTDIDAKLEYVPNIKDVSGSSPINRVNSSHTCVFDDLEIHFVTLANEKKDQEISYTEEAALSVDVNFITDYRLKESEGGTALEVRILPKRKVLKNKSPITKILGGFKEKLILARIKGVTRKNLVIFKNYCERIARERRSND